MAFPQGLFVEDPQMQDVSLHSLSQDTDEWSEEIIQRLKERIPRSSSMNAFVKFMKKDDENGTATGSIVVADSKKQVVLPLIIKEFMMFPLDVMIADKRLLPLTPDNFDRIFNSNDVFDGIEEYPVFGGLGRFEDANLWNATYPPSLGRYAYASANFEIMNDIVGTFDGSELKSYLLENPEVAANFAKRGHAEAIKKIANTGAVNMNEFRQGVEKLIDRPITMLRRQGPNHYSILANSDKVFSPAFTDVKRPELHKTLVEITDDAQDCINEVDSNGEKWLTVPTQDESVPFVYIAAPEKKEVELADEFDHYVVKSNRGVEHKGVVIPKVIGFDMESKDLKIFIGKTMSTIQPEIAGIRIQNPDNFNQLEGEKIKVGQTGTFVYMINKSKGLATIPVTIKSMVFDCGCLKVMAMDNMGGGYKLKFDPANKLARIAKVGDCYCMPGEFRWVPMEGFEQISNSAADFMAKTAGQVKTANPWVLCPTGYGQYALRGSQKYASACGWDHTNLEEYQAKFLLGSMGMGEGSQELAFKVAAMRGQAEIHGIKNIPLQSEKVAEARPLARRLTKIADGLRVNLWKEASYMAESQTVDSLLSLNFVNPENISKFVNKLPSLKNTVSHLASLLIASRLGISEIPEQATSTAMYRILDVINGLETLKAQSESQK